MPQNSKSRSQVANQTTIFIDLSWIQSPSKVPLFGWGLSKLLLLTQISISISYHLRPQFWRWFPHPKPIGLPEIRHVIVIILGLAIHGGSHSFKAASHWAPGTTTTPPSAETRWIRLGAKKNGWWLKELSGEFTLCLLHPRLLFWVVFKGSSDVWMTVWSGWDWSTSISVFRITWWHELTMSAGPQKTHETRSWVWSSHPYAGNGGKAYAKNFRKTRKNIDKANSPSCGPCLMTTTKGYANTWEPVERDQIESCESAPVAVEARRKHGSETKALLQVLSKDQKDQPVLTVCSFQKLFWNVLKTETFRSKSKMWLTCTLPTIKSRWVGDIGDTPQPSPFFFEVRRYLGYEFTKSAKNRWAVPGWLTLVGHPSIYFWVYSLNPSFWKGATGLFVCFFRFSPRPRFCFDYFRVKKTHQRETTFHPLVLSIHCLRLQVLHLPVGHATKAVPPCQTWAFEPGWFRGLWPV